MFSKSPLRLAIAALIAAPVCAHAEFEISAELKNETAFFTNNGPSNNERKRMLDDGNSRFNARPCPNHGYAFPKLRANV